MIKHRLMSNEHLRKFISVADENKISAPPRSTLELVYDNEKKMGGRKRKPNEKLVAANCVLQDKRKKKNENSKDVISESDAAAFDKVFYNSKATTSNAEYNLTIADKKSQDTHKKKKNSKDLSFQLKQDFSGDHSVEQIATNGGLSRSPTPKNRKKKIELDNNKIGNGFNDKYAIEESIDDYPVSQEKNKKKKKSKDLSFQSKQNSSGDHQSVETVDDDGGLSRLQTPKKKKKGLDNNKIEDCFDGKYATGQCIADDSGLQDKHKKKKKSKDLGFQSKQHLPIEAYSVEQINGDNMNTLQDLTKKKKKRKQLVIDEVETCNDVNLKHVQCKEDSSGGVENNPSSHTRNKKKKDLDLRSENSTSYSIEEIDDVCVSSSNPKKKNKKKKNEVQKELKMCNEENLKHSSNESTSIEENLKHNSILQALEKKKNKKRKPFELNDKTVEEMFKKCNDEILNQHSSTENGIVADSSFQNLKKKKEFDLELSNTNNVLELSNESVKRKKKKRKNLDLQHSPVEHYSVDETIEHNSSSESLKTKKKKRKDVNLLINDDVVNVVEVSNTEILNQPYLYDNLKPISKKSKKRKHCGLSLSSNRVDDNKISEVEIEHQNILGDQSENTHKSSHVDLENSVLVSIDKNIIVNQEESSKANNILCNIGKAKRKKSQTSSPEERKKSKSTKYFESLDHRLEALKDSNCFNEEMALNTSELKNKNMRSTIGKKTDDVASVHGTTEKVALELSAIEQIDKETGNVSIASIPMTSLEKEPSFAAAGETDDSENDVSSSLHTSCDSSLEKRKKEKKKLKKIISTVRGDEEQDATAISNSTSCGKYLKNTELVSINDNIFVEQEETTEDSSTFCRIEKIKKKKSKKSSSPRKTDTSHFDLLNTNVETEPICSDYEETLYEDVGLEVLDNIYKRFRQSEDEGSTTSEKDTIETSAGGKTQIDIQNIKPFLTKRQQTFNFDCLQEVKACEENTITSDTKESPKLTVVRKSGSPFAIEVCRKIFRNAYKGFDADLSLEHYHMYLMACEEDEALAKVVQKKLMGLSIKISWPVHPLHCIGKNVLLPPRPNEKLEIEKMKLPLKKGIFSQAEDKLIQRNWIDFCKTHDIPDNPKPFINFSKGVGSFMGLENKRKFAQFLAHDLNDRLLCSVYTRFQRLYSNKHSNRFTKAEDDIIINYVCTRKSRGTYLELGRILGRDNASIEKHCKKLLQDCTTLESVKFTKEKIGELLENLMECFKTDKIDDLKDKTVTNSQWRKISEKMNIPFEKLRSSWLYRIYPSLFGSEEYGKLKGLAKKLVDKLRERGETDWRGVDWDTISKDFEGFTGEALNKKMKMLAYYNVPYKMRGDLRECLAILEKVSFRDHRLKQFAVLNEK